MYKTEALFCRSKLLTYKSSDQDLEGLLDKMKVFLILTFAILLLDSADVFTNGLFCLDNYCGDHCKSVGCERSSCSSFSHWTKCECSDCIGKDVQQYGSCFLLNPVHYNIKSKHKSIFKQCYTSCSYRD
uniref:Uncharacterized protein n=1 Tax=Magallana gigas TaxID=29159 RepID=A0A8W8M091_MAGGI